ncbi:hypothetical protein [Methylovulum psychrotolerans]|nr:hypothetical protein [Methylovulum psychrotolerans]
MSSTTHTPLTFIAKAAPTRSPCACAQTQTYGGNPHPNKAG